MTAHENFRLVFSSLAASDSSLSSDHIFSRVQQHVVVCDAATGKVYKATNVSSGGLYNWPDAQLLAEGSMDKLIYFENTSGPRIDVAYQISKLSEQEMQRVLEAYGEYKAKKLRPITQGTPLNNG